VADDFVGVSVEGKVQSRADLMAEAKRSKVTRSIASEMRVRILGPDAAVVTGIWSGAGTDPAGQKFDIVDRWTDIFVRKDGKWKCVAQQSTIVPK
jgi:ketosteroid isomerase-like protein